MTCNQSPIRTIQTETATIFSKGGTSPSESDIFVLSPEAIVQIAPLLRGIRATVNVENATDSFFSKAVFQTTSDGITWDAAVSLENATAGNRKSTTDWHMTAADFKRGIRVGVLASQAANIDTVQMARVTLIIDFDLRS